MSEERKRSEVLVGACLGCRLLLLRSFPRRSECFGQWEASQRSFPTRLLATDSSRLEMGDFRLIKGIRRQHIQP
jgi:hypothetical protein